MNFIKCLAVSIVILASFSASAATVGQKCRPLGPLSPSDTVDKIARCSCESGALIAGAAFQRSSSDAYRPEDIRQWADKRKQTVVWTDLDSNFVTLVESTPLGQDRDRLQKREHYYYYQGADTSGSGAEQMVLGEIVINVDSPADGRGFTNCSVISASTKLN